MFCNSSNKQHLWSKRKKKRKKISDLLLEMNLVRRLCQVKTVKENRDFIAIVIAV